MENVNEKFEEIKNEVIKLIDSMKVDADKFYVKNQKAAGTRLRKGYKSIIAYVKAASAETSIKNKD